MGEAGAYPANSGWGQDSPWRAGQSIADRLTQIQFDITNQLQKIVFGLQKESGALRSFVCEKQGQGKHANFKQKGLILQKLLTQNVAQDNLLYDKSTFSRGRPEM